ncbi:MAG: hypothetical protein BGO49_26130 [Planctomycetales bacterium 71-10]|nr:MAG: hypothetical protein BGO49_26130 [Planctomycetales bacterium 71-10]
MTAAHTHEETIEHPIMDRLRRAGIMKAAIIDDAFDPLHRDDLEAEIADFWNAIQRDEDSVAELRAVAMAVASEDEPVPAEISDEDITDAVLNDLWDRRKAFTKLAAPLAEHLFAQRLIDLAPLEELKKHLKEAGVEPIPLGSEEDLPEPFKLVFLDWLLGPGPGTSASHLAESRARRLYEEPGLGSDADKPFIILMSSKPTEAAAAKDHFRAASGLLGGLFGFVAKDELKDRTHLFMRLTAWSLELPARHDIQRFVEALEVGLKGAEAEFTRRIRSLRFEDYANIQSLSLHAEGHPLGDYMLWLYKSLLSHLLHSQARVREQQKRLDAMSYKEYVPVEEHPSPELAEIYQCALTEPAVEEMGHHPRAGRQGEEKQLNEGKEPYLQLGDLFFKEAGGDEVIMVANAACDLAFSPGEDRAFRPDQPVLLMRGRLQRYEVVDNSGAVRTELIRHENRPYRILWDVGHVTSCEYGKVAAWFEERKLRRKARLALPYALEVQQAFTTRVARLGMPVRPPICRRADVEVYFKGDKGVSKRAGETIFDGAVVIRGRSADGKDEDQFVITLECARKIANSLAEPLAGCEKEKAECEAQLQKPGQDEKSIQRAREKLTGAENKVNKIRRLLDPSLDWLTAARRPKAVPTARSETPAKIDDALLWVYNERDFSGQYKPNLPIVLNLLVKDHPATMPQDVEVSSTVASPEHVEGGSEPGQVASASGGAKELFASAEAERHERTQASIPDITSSNGE